MRVLSKSHTTAMTFCGNSEGMARHFRGMPGYSQERRHRLYCSNGRIPPKGSKTVSVRKARKRSQLFTSGSRDATEHSARDANHPRETLTRGPGHRTHRRQRNPRTGDNESASLEI